VILKTAVKPTLNAFTIAKAWRVEDRESLLARYDEACTMVDPGVIMIQELIPGSGEEQFSYAALCLDGRPLAGLVARRTR
jgi:D-aspartate ligase